MVSDLIRYLARERSLSFHERARLGSSTATTDDSNISNLSYAWMVFEEPRLGLDSAKVPEKEARTSEIESRSIDTWEQAKISYRSVQGNIFVEARDIHVGGANDNLKDTLFAFFRLGKDAPTSWRTNRPQRVDKEYGRMSTVLVGLNYPDKNQRRDEKTVDPFGTGMSGKL
jgi:hypothetical protein